MSENATEVGSVLVRREAQEATAGRAVTGAQVRAARKLLGWSAYRVGKLCGASNAAIYQFENTGQMPSSMFNRTDPVDRVAVIRAGLEAAGVTFVEENGAGPGVRLRGAGAE